jgi:type II restriction enzyme
VRLHLPVELAADYRSSAQRARVITESWAQRNLFCPNCDSLRLSASPANTPAVDFVCEHCDSQFQLKGQSKPYASRIMDAAYSAMIRAIRENRTPNLWALHYDPETWLVRNLLLIPAYAFGTSAIEKRKPLSGKARRAGWVGCNIILTLIPQDARIPVVTDGRIASSEEVRRKYRRLASLQEMDAEARGWTLDVLTVVRALNQQEFTLDEVYAYEQRLRRLHPRNRHVRDKIRQQLQVLRDMGLLKFLRRGQYRLL